MQPGGGRYSNAFKVVKGFTEPIKMLWGSVVISPEGKMFGPNSSGWGKSNQTPDTL